MVSRTVLRPRPISSPTTREQDLWLPVRARRTQGSEQLRILRTWRTTSAARSPLAAKCWHGTTKSSISSASHFLLSRRILSLIDGTRHREEKQKQNIRATRRLSFSSKLMDAAKNRRELCFVQWMCLLFWSRTSPRCVDCLFYYWTCVVFFCHIAFYPSIHFPITASPALRVTVVLEPITAAVLWWRDGRKTGKQKRSKRGQTLKMNLSFLGCLQKSNMYLKTKPCWSGLTVESHIEATSFGKQNENQ